MEREAFLDEVRLVIGGLVRDIDWCPKTEGISSEFEPGLDSSTDREPEAETTGDALAKRAL